MNELNGTSQDETINDMPINIGLEKLNTNEVFHQSELGVFDDSNIADRPYYMDASLKNDVSNQHTSRDNYDKGINNEIGSTGAYEEYTATREEELKGKPIYDTDATKTVSNMNVEGMPWFYEEPGEDEKVNRQSVPQLSNRETRRFIFSSLLAALLVAGVFIGVIFLFLLFATNVWLR